MCACDLESIFSSDFLAHGNRTTPARFGERALAMMQGSAEERGWGGVVWVWSGRWLHQLIKAARQVFQESREGVLKGPLVVAFPLMVPLNVLSHTVLVCLLHHHCPSTPSDSNSQGWEFLLWCCNGGVAMQSFQTMGLFLFALSLSPIESCFSHF